LKYFRDTTAARLVGGEIELKKLDIQKKGKTEDRLSSKLKNSYVVKGNRGDIGGKRVEETTRP